MSINSVYITRTAYFLPGSGISNDEMEEYLGLINGKSSKSRRIVLRNNGIKNRYYALTKDGVATHTNAEMASLAIKKLFDGKEDELKSVKLLCCGTSTPDQIMPSHAVLVHGWLNESAPMEVISPAGNCCAGMHALKYAYLSIKGGEAKTAIASGSERTSRALNVNSYEEEIQQLAKLDENPYISFEKDFLRWMLSDGAGAFLLSNTKAENQLNLRIDWLEGVSYAHQVETCMYQGSDKLENGQLKGFMDFTQDEIISKSILSIKQDVKLLSENIVTLGFDKLKDIIADKGLDVNEITYFLPHMSSEFFRSKMAEILEKNGNGIPQEKWFTNLTSIGNVGAGSIYLMVDELLNSGKLKVGDKILLAVPESARFSYVFGLLTVC